jgi:NhaA family Na+:H+ antiporter
MYRVSPFVRRFAQALLSGMFLATLWVTLAPASYYDALEWRLLDLDLPRWLAPLPVSLTPMLIVSHLMMPLFVAFIAKELWEALVLSRGAMAGRQALAPVAAILGGAMGAVLIWIAVAALIVTNYSGSFAQGWQVPVGGDVVLAYFVARAVFGAGHPALHVSLLLAIGLDILGLLLTGLTDPEATLRLAWLALPAVAVLTVWRLVAHDPGPTAGEARRRRAMALWPYVLAGVISWVGVVASGLPPELGLLPVLVVIPHADRSFGVFAEAEAFLHDPLNQLAHHLVKPLAVVLFCFGLTRGGIDLGAFAPTTLVLIAALWIGKPLGLLIVLALAARLLGARLPAALTRRDVVLVAMIAGMGFTVPALSLESALPGGLMAEAARLGLAISLLAGPAALAVSRLMRR